MECSTTKSRLTAYLAHELPLDERSQVRQHLEQCPNCQDELATLTKLDQLLDLQPVMVPPVELGESIMAAISQIEPQKAKDLSARQVVVWGTALVACFCLVVLPLLAWWWRSYTGSSIIESASLWSSAQSSEIAGTMGFWSSLILATRQWLLSAPRLGGQWFQNQLTTLTAFYGKYVIQIALAALGTTIIAVSSLRMLARWDERWSEGAMMRRSRSN